MIRLETHFIWFMLYSFVGWVWEVIICSIGAKKFVNRGFLNGPYCPIYGTGAILIILLLSSIENPLLLFLAGVAVTSVLEYFTSWAMEKLFHARWWDYSNRRFNINGRVYLLGGVAFGAMSVLLLKVMHPVVSAYTLMLPELAISIIALVLFTLTLIDLVYTVTRLSEFDKKLAELTEKLENLKKASAEQRSVSKQNQKQRLNEIYEKLYKKINRQERRVIKAYPRLYSTKNNEALKRLKQHIDNIKKSSKPDDDTED